MQIIRVFISFVLLATSLSCLAEKEELVYLNLGPLPNEARVYKIEKEVLEKTITAMKIQKEKWSKFEGMKISYIVRQETISIGENDPCGTLPIKVILKDRRLISAKYAASGGKCKQGQSIGSKQKEMYWLSLTPNELYSRIELTQEQLKCYLGEGEKYCMPTALRVTYDERFGFPIKMEDSGELVMDYYWSLEVTDLEVAM
jgi:hypothetical protein